MSSFFSDRDYGPDDDPFAGTRMSFGDHIEDLRTHLMRAVLGFLVALVLSFFVASSVLEFINAPVEAELMDFYNRRVQRVRERLAEKDPKLEAANKPTVLEQEVALRPLAQVLGVKLPANAPEWAPLKFRIRPIEIVMATAEAERMVGRRPTLSTLTVMEGFIVYFKVAIFCGIVLAAPWIFYQVWSFVAAGLYPHEKRYVNVYLPISLFLFLGGVIMCEWVVIPRAVEYLLSFNEWLNLEPELRLSDWLTFAIFTPLIFGVAFQTPLVMLFLVKLRLLSVEKYRSYRRVAWFILAILAAVLSASPDVFSFLALTFPLWALYELGILLCRFAPAPAPEIELPEEEEMVEV